MTSRIVGVVGAGTMGNGIAQVFAQAGFSVILTDVSQAALDRGLAAISSSLSRLVKKAYSTTTRRCPFCRASAAAPRLPIWPAASW